MPRKIITLAVMLLVLFATPTTLQAKKKKIEEATWKVRITPDAAAAKVGEKQTDDTLILQQGFLRLRGSDDHGFNTAPYLVKGADITAQTKSAREGKIDWTANWHEDTIAGRMLWTRPDGTVLTYTFSGTRAAVEKARKHR